MSIDDQTGTDFNVVVERDEDGFYVASVPGLRGCHTQAPTLDLVLERIKEAIALHLETETDFIARRGAIKPQTGYAAGPTGE